MDNLDKAKKKVLENLDKMDALDHDPKKQSTNSFRMAHMGQARRTTIEPEPDVDIAKGKDHRKHQSTNRRLSTGKKSTSAENDDTQSIAAATDAGPSQSASMAPSMAPSAAASAATSARSFPEEEPAAEGDQNQRKSTGNREDQEDTDAEDGASGTGGPTTAAAATGTGRTSTPKSKGSKGKAPSVSDNASAIDLRRSRAHGRSRSETEPLLMSLPELTKFLQAKELKRKAKITQRQRAALLGILPPGTTPPPKVVPRQIVGSVSAAGAGGVEGKQSTATIPGGPSKSILQRQSEKPRLRRKSLLDHMEKKMEKEGHRTILFRMVVIGSHEEPPNEILEYNENRMKEFNVAPEIELLSGLLIVYPKHFFHVLEGPEMALSNFIEDAANEFEKKRTMKNLQEGDRIWRVKMIILGTFQVDQRFMKKWQGVVTGYPAHSNLMEVNGYQARLFELMKRTWTLLIVARNFIALLPSIEEASAAEAMSVAPSQSVQSKMPEDSPPPPPPPAQSKAITKATESDFGLGLELSMASFAPPPPPVDNINESVNEVMEESMGLLPSLPIIEYFLKDKERCPKLLTPQQFIDKYWRLSDEPSWRDVVWPIPTHLYPYD